MLPRIQEPKQLMYFKTLLYILVYCYDDEKWKIT